MPEHLPYDRTRPKVIAELRSKLSEYGAYRAVEVIHAPSERASESRCGRTDNMTDDLLFKTQQVHALQRPSNRDYGSFRNWFEATKPLVQEEFNYIRRREDLVTLRIGRECAGFDGCVESCLTGTHALMVKCFGCHIVKVSENSHLLPRFHFR